VKLGEINAPPRKRKRRVGRGKGSGFGKTCGRGHGGQMCRSGAVHRAWFEGGQMPLIRRIPKRGFTNAKYMRKVAEIDLDKLMEFEAGTVVTPELLRQRGMVKGRFDAIKVLANGELDRALDVRVHLWSAGAEKKIKAAGGSLTPPEPAGE
jgi:large subunit ribosomal protein L15